MLTGGRGCVFEAVGSLIDTLLPSAEAAISIARSDDEIRIDVGDVGNAVIQPLRDQEGRQTKVLHGAAAFREETCLGKTTASRFAPADLHEWDSLGHAEWADVSWSG